ncbi:hypothetical protein DFH27DRAFT_2844 [Peziza echinospora]|nr:hypothetical protein DFH27DRAFT_2844 [Peziza echinospora]
MAHQQTPNPSALSAAINASTRELHDSINKIVMVRIALGFRDIRLFREGILSFFYIYQTFEAEWSRLLAPDSPIPARKRHILNNLYHPVLTRTNAALNDLAFYYDLDSTDAALERFSEPTTPARKAYAAHIRAVIEKEPLVIISYAHNMYLALFAGGRVIKSRMLSVSGFFPRKTGLSKAECARLGTHLFTFDVENGKEEDIRNNFKYRLANVEVDITPEETAVIVEESKEVFRQNLLLINELDTFKPEAEPASPTSLAISAIMFIMAISLAIRITTHLFPGAIDPYLTIAEDLAGKLFHNIPALRAADVRGKVINKSEL